MNCSHLRITGDLAGQSRAQIIHDTPGGVVLWILVCPAALTFTTMSIGHQQRHPHMFAEGYAVQWSVWYGPNSQICFYLTGAAGAGDYL